MNSLPSLPARKSDSHKGDFGRILIIAGSKGMSGAAVLTATACLRSGAGLVTIATPVTAQPQVALGHPSVMTIGLPESSVGQIGLEAMPKIQKLIPKYDFVAYGPGLSRSLAVDRLAGWLFRSSPCPVVLDADGLNGLAIEIGLGNIPRASVATPRILTPHPGEMQRLWNAVAKQKWVNEEFAPSSQRSVQEAQAKQLAVILGCIVLLKGSSTYITDGNSEHRNLTGNPGMATAGSGDCLTGVITALLPVMRSAYSATILGAHIHGLAGDMAAQSLGQVAMTSQDLIQFLPKAWQTENLKL